MFFASLLNILLQIIGYWTLVKLDDSRGSDSEQNRLKELEKKRLCEKNFHSEICREFYTVRSNKIEEFHAEIAGKMLFFKIFPTG